MEAVQTGTGRAAAFGRPAAGKTGTSQDNRDGWFIGFTNDLVVGVWVGRDDSEPVEGLQGGGMPARIWRDFMIGAYSAPPGGGEPVVAGAGRATALADMAPNAQPGSRQPMTLQDIGDVIRNLFE
jgi:membrane peptidoglycan carboxypeptidase